MAEKHKKGYVATLPTLWATSDLVPRFEAEGLPDTAGGIFLVPPYVSILKILRILWRIQKWLKSTKKVM